MARKKVPDFEVAEPVRHARFEEVGPEPKVGAEPSDGRQAVIVCHGMGQQVPFKTLADVAAGVQANSRVERPIKGRTVWVGDERLRRLEMTLRDDSGTAKEVDVYEVYWAPVTEGKVTLRDVFRFLGAGATRGIGVALSRSKHLRFGEHVRAGRFWQAMQVLWTVVLLASVFAVTAVATLAVGELVAKGTLDFGRFAEASWMFVPFLLAVLAYGFPLVTTVLMRYRSRHGAIGWVGFVVMVMVLPFTAFGVVAEAVAPGWLPLSDWVQRLPYMQTVYTAELFAADLAVAPLAATVAVYVVALFARRFAIQYVGDVAAYVSSHKLDRFQEIRSEIKKRAACVGEAVYSARRDDHSFLYSGVAVVGHSLGSVVAYDLMNALVNQDLAHKRWHVAKRTSLLLTFGSPLDKIAWFFRTHNTSMGRQDDLDKLSTKAREALAAAVQPLITSYDNRGFRWINVYSPADPISGALDLYDAPKPKPQDRVVENVRDPFASFPLLAHTSYWANTQVWKCLREALYGADHDDCRVRGHRAVRLRVPVARRTEGQEPA